MASTFLLIAAIFALMDWLGRRRRKEWRLKDRPL
jgi:hypothetical protein